MTYAYDEESQEIRKGSNKVGWAAAAAAGLALIALITGILNGTPGLLTTFSSIPAPPGPPTPWVEWWKNVYRNDAQVDAWWSTSIAVTETTTLAISDRITTTTPFTLTELWDSAVLTLTGYITETGGTVISSTGAMTWMVASPVITTTRYELVKSWEVLTYTFTTALITETLVTAGGAQTVTIALTPGTPPTPTPTLTPSPTLTPTLTPTRTPRPTYTPRYTPKPSGTTPFPTSTPCVVNCGGLYVPYRLYLPMVCSDNSD